VVGPDGEVRAAARDTDVPPAVLAWAERADGVVADATRPDAEGPEADVVRFRAAAKAYGPRGVATLLLASAAGSGDAARVLERVLGELADEPVRMLRDDLSDRAAATVDAEVGAVLEALGTPDPADDVAAGLRVRLAELRRLT
jgi:phage-related baseplate assembly protein